MLADHERAEQTLLRARERFFNENGFPSDGGYNAAWVTLKLGSVRVQLPNISARRRAVAYHDLHHILTGYGTDFRGEAEVASWEIGAGGCGANWEPWLVNFCAVGIGVLICPVRTWKAFGRGRSCSNLYPEPICDALLGETLHAVRRKLALSERTKTATVADGFRFSAWAIVSLLTLCFIWVGLVGTIMVLAYHALRRILGIPHTDAGGAE